MAILTPSCARFIVASCTLLVTGANRGLSLSHSRTSLIIIRRYSVLAPQVVYGPVRISQEEREAALAAWKARLQNIEAEEPIEIGEY